MAVLLFRQEVNAGEKSSERYQDRQNVRANDRRRGDTFFLMVLRAIIDNYDRPIDGLRHGRRRRRHPREGAR